MFSPKPNARRPLTVEVLEARGLLPAEANHTVHVCAVTSVVLEGRTIDEGVKRTNVVKGTLAPKWKPQVMSFGSNFNLNREGPYLLVQVVDRGLLGGETELGEVSVHWTAEGLDTEQWYRLHPYGSLQHGADLGEVRIKINIPPAVVSQRGSVSIGGLPANRLLARALSSLEVHQFDHAFAGEVGESDEAPEHSEMDPNLLKVKVVQARGLIIGDRNITGGGSSDPFVKLFLGQQEVQTKVIPQTLEPVWNETFCFPCRDSSQVLAVYVEDRDLIGNDFLGAMNLDMAHLKHKKKVARWYALGLQDGSESHDDLGEIYLEAQWFYDPERAVEEDTPGGTKWTGAVGSLLKRSVGMEDAAEDTEGEDEKGKSDDLKGANLAAEQQAAAEAAEEQKAKLKSELMDIEVKSGDYMIYVHIIEARDLKGEDAQGTSDPVVYVQAFGQRFATEVKNKCLNAVWDETFVISCRNLDKEEFEQGVIRIAVMDADIGIGALGTALFKSDLIGVYSFDAKFVYSQIDHEVHRRWLALYDDENPKDTGVQGYLKMSIAIVGPGDKLKVHDDEADRIHDREEEARSGGFDKLVLMPASIGKEQRWLVTTMWKAEYLPQADQAGLGATIGGGDYYASVVVAGGKPLKTKRIRMDGNRHTLNPAWRTELWYPVALPSASGLVKYTVADWDAIGRDDVVGTFTGKLKAILGASAGTLGPRWVPMFGPPIDLPERANFTTLGRTMGTIGRGNMNWKDVYTNFPDKGSTYRGRVLITEEIRTTLPREHKKERTPWKRKVKALSHSREPSTRNYALACYVATGTSIPRFGDPLTANRKSLPMWVRVSVGKTEIATHPSENEHGVCVWYEMLENDHVQLPADPKQIPDVVVHLMRGVGSNALPVCFARYSAADLLLEKFHGGPQWVSLKEDKVLDCLEPGQFPGSLLVRLGFGLRSTYERLGDAWRKEQEGLSGQKFPYEVRLHIFQCRDLPASDYNGLMDPYLKVSLLGQEMSTEEYVDKETGLKTLQHRETTDPTYYYTHCWPTLLPQPRLKKWFPQISIGVFDHETFGPDEYAGKAYVPLAQCVVEDPRAIRPPPQPKWVPIFKEAPGDSTGEILLSCQVIRKISKTQEIPPPPSLMPQTREAWIEALIIGIRGMAPYQMMPMQLPYAEIEIGLGQGEKRLFQTEPSQRPSGADANFLQRIKFKMPLPTNEIFAPRAKIRVHDTRLGGFLTPLVAAGSIDLRSKLPWSSAYVPPTANAVDAEALLAAAAAEADAEDIAGLEEANGAAQDEEAAAHLVSPALTALAAAIPQLGVVKVSSVGRDMTAGAAANSNGGNADVERRASLLATKTTSLRMSGAIAPLSGTGSSFGPSRQTSGVMGLLRGASVRGTADEKEEEKKELEMEEEAKDEVLGTMPVTQQAEGSDKAGSAGPGNDDDKDEEEEHDGPPKYMDGRTVLEGELEAELITTPFETYNLMRGKEEDCRVVGKLKCIVRVTLEDPDDVPLFTHPDQFVDKGGLAAAQKENNRVLTELLKPKGYKLRLYVLRALNLTPMDMGIGGRPGNSDPYLKVTLGRETFNDSANSIDDVTDADLFKCVELNVELPGASQLDIAIMDKDDFGGDELIGRTVIDLEDRWFDQRWQGLGMANRCGPNAEGKSLRWQTKPLERRHLYVPVSKAPQGVLECWLDIMPQGDANIFPPDDVALPPTQDFEVRLVIWKCKDVVSQDEITDMNDLFVRAWVDGCDPLETDTHWRAKKGKGSFNWRMKFTVELGPRTHAWKFPYLLVQLWDQDIVKANDVIAEGMFDLGPAFNRAYKKKEVVKLFTGASSQAMARAKKAAAMAANDDINAAVDDQQPHVDDRQPLLGEGSAAHQQGAAASGAASVLEMVHEPEARRASSPSSISQSGSKPADPQPPQAAVATSSNATLASSGSGTGPGGERRGSGPEQRLEEGLAGTGAATASSQGGLASRVSAGRSGSMEPIAEVLDQTPLPLSTAGSAVAVPGPAGGGAADVVTAAPAANVGASRPAASVANISVASSGAGSARGESTTGRIKLWPPRPTSGSRRSQPATSFSDGQGDSDSDSDSEEEENLEGEVLKLAKPSPPTPVKERIRMLRRRGKKAQRESSSDDEEMGLEPGRGKKTKKGSGDNELREFISSIKVMTGLFDEDPLETHWLHLERTDRKTGKKVPMGKCCIGVQVWPIAKAVAQPAGFGRSSPNHFPFLPPPTGRLEFSFNPFKMGADIVGPKVCCYLVCILCCLIFIILLIICEPLVSIALSADSVA